MDETANGGYGHPMGRDSDTGSRSFSHHLTSPLWLLLFAQTFFLKCSRVQPCGQAGCTSRLLCWLIRSIYKQGRKGARLCSQGKVAFPRCR